MSRETLQHLNTKTLIGNTDARGTAWHYRAEEQGAETKEIVSNVAKAATGTGAVTHNIVEVAKASEATGSAANLVLASASVLSGQSEQLNVEVRGFLTAVRAG